MESLSRSSRHAGFYENVETDAGRVQTARSTPGPIMSPTLDTRSSSHTAPRRSQSLRRSSSIFGRPTRRKSIVKQPRIDFRRLPYTVFQCILDQLYLLHNDRLSPTCSTCYMRDLTSMQLTCSAWDADAKKRLYEHIDISGADSPEQLRNYRMQRGSRLKLLRRTFREHKLLPSLVRTLNIPDPNIPLFLPNGQPNPEFNAYGDLVASVVLLCPNLERLTGFYTVYNHDFDRLTHALSTRTRLKEHVWIIGENDEISARCEKQLAPGLIDQYQRYEFLHYHKAWSSLECLMLCSPGGVGIIEHNIFTEMLSSLPALKHLCISSFDSDDFTDATLSFLPKLVSLRLEECSGVTETGLARWSASPNAYRLQTLSLIHQNIMDLTKIARVLSSLCSLRKFVVIQSDVSPKVPSDDITFQPLLASPSLEELHWDITTEAVDLEYPMSIMQSKELLESGFSKTESLPANAHLALSILHLGFPRLKMLRAPQDIAPPGILQAVCLPSRSRSILLPSDKLETRPMPAVFQRDIPRTNSLQVARLRAQGYIDGNFGDVQQSNPTVVMDHSSQAGDSAEKTSRSNSFASSNETNITEINEIFGSDDHISTQQGVSRSTTNSSQTSYGSDPKASVPISVELADPWSESLLSHKLCQFDGLQPPSIPLRSPMRGAPSTMAMRMQESSLPSIMGRYTTTGSKAAQPPRFNLLPDIPGHDGNGGIIGWGDLLRISERSSPATSTVETHVKDGCTGAWNKDSSRGPQWARHVARERRREETIVKLEHFF